MSGTTDIERQVLLQLTELADDYPLHGKIEQLFSGARDLSRLSQEDMKTLIEELQQAHLELKRQNEALRFNQGQLIASLERFTDLYQQAPIGYITLNGHGVVTEVNQMCCDLLHATRQEIVNRPLSYIVAKIDLDRFYVFLRNLYTTFPIGHSHTIEVRLTYNNRIKTYVELIGRVEAIDGEKMCRLVVRNIERQKEFEQQQRLMQAAVEFSTDAISISDILEPDNPIIYVSPKFEEITGYKSAEVLGKNWRVLYRADPDLEAQAILKAAIEAQRECRTIVRNTRKNGEKYMSEVTLYPLTDELGRVSHYVSIIRDVTEQIKADAAIEQAQRLDSVGVLAGGIAHDFNNMLTAIMAQTSMAEMRMNRKPALDSIDEKVQGNLEKIYASAVRAADLTRQLLAYAGRGQFEVTDIDLNELIQETVGLALSSRPKGVTLNLDLSDHKLRISADKGQINQVILNLVVNAWESIPSARSGAISIRTDAFFVHQPEDLDDFIMGSVTHFAEAYALITVSDNGIGMEPETISRIFDPFYTTKKQGHGLGLSAVLGVIRSHQGGIQVRSEVDVGTTFSVLIPIYPDRLQDITTEVDPPIETHALVPFSVLVIDDEEPIRNTLQEMMAMMNGTTYTAKDGETGIEMYRRLSGQIDLVVLDMHMPGLDGEETFRRLREIDASVKYLFSSGFSESEARLRLADIDTNAHFLQKPYDFRTIQNKIRSILPPRQPN